MADRLLIEAQVQVEADMLNIRLVSGPSNLSGLVL